MIKFRHVKQIWEENNMELARIFCECMVLQRNMPLVVWGNWNLCCNIPAMAKRRSRGGI